jgi:phage terminase large subunit-like protein
MSPPSKDLMQLVMEGKIRHGCHPVLDWNMSNIVVKTDPAGNIKPDKSKSTEKIDGAVAMIMGLSRAMLERSNESVYDREHRGIFFI